MLHNIAAEAAEAFETAERPEGETFDRLKKDRPEWIAGAVRDAHGADFLPDDYRYAFTRAAFQAIADAGEDADLDDVAAEFEDGADVYTSDLLAWAGSHVQRIGYVDEAREDFGAGSFGSVADELRAGQAAERREVFAAVRAAVEHEADERRERGDELNAALRRQAQRGY